MQHHCGYRGGHEVAGHFREHTAAGVRPSRDGGPDIPFTAGGNVASAERGHWLAGERNATGRNVCGAPAGLDNRAIAYVRAVSRLSVLEAWRNHVQCVRIARSGTRVSWTLLGHQLHGGAAYA